MNKLVQYSCRIQDQYTQKNQLYFYILAINNPKIKLRKQFQYLGINLPKETEDLYIENYKTLMIEIKDDTNGKIYHVHGLEESIPQKQEVLSAPRS